LSVKGVAADRNGGTRRTLHKRTAHGVAHPVAAAVRAHAPETRRDHIVASASASMAPPSLDDEDTSVGVLVKQFKDGSIVERASLNIATAGENARGLVHRYVVHVRQNMRRGTASTKTRSEVSGGGKKPYAQKGTGRARQGSSRTPLRPGGGVIFGPKPRDWSQKMNKKERWLALSSALRNVAESSADAADSEGASDAMFVIDSMESQFADDGSDVKTRVMVSRLRGLGVAEGERALIIGKEGVPEDVMRSGNNIPWLTFNTVRSGIHITDVLQADKVFLSRDAFEYVNDRFSCVESEEEEEEDEEEEEVAENDAGAAEADAEAGSSE